jgi:uracil-DNA glycosylase
LPVVEENSGIYNALSSVDFENVKVLIIGQDPYPNIEDAHGLAFSKKTGKCPASLKNIFAKIKEETGIENTNANLTHWAQQGVLLLNRALTFTKTESLAKRTKFWAPVVDGIIEKLLNRNTPLVVILWGNQANEIEQFCNTKDNILILRSSHPSNMGNAKNTPIMDGKIPAFTQAKLFGRCNEFLKQNGLKEIDWSTD